jgi:hypothetical protein
MLVQTDPKLLSNHHPTIRFNVDYKFITISLGSDKCPLNCAVSRTLADNGRPAFQYLRIDELSI